MASVPPKKPDPPKKAGRAMFVNQVDALLTVPDPGLALAKSLYEEVDTLPTDVVRKTVLAAAETAFRNADSPNKTQGGIKQALNM